MFTSSTVTSLHVVFRVCFLIWSLLSMGWCLSLTYKNPAFLTFSTPIPLFRPFYSLTHVSYDLLWTLQSSFSLCSCFEMWFWPSFLSFKCAFCHVQSAVKISNDFFLSEAIISRTGILLMITIIWGNLPFFDHPFSSYSEFSVYINHGYFR